jgi:hypothetical protein
MLPLRTYVSDPMMRQVHFAFCDWPPERRHPPPPADNSALRLRLFCSLRCFMHLVFCSRPRLAPPLSTVRHLHRASSEFYQPGPGRTTKFSEIEYPITHTSPPATRVTPPQQKHIFYFDVLHQPRHFFCRKENTKNIGSPASRDPRWPQPRIGVLSGAHYSRSYNLGCGMELGSTLSRPRANFSP